MILKNLSIRATALILAFILGLIIAALWALHHLPTGQHVSRETDTAISICEVLKQPNQYNLQTVKIEAIVIGYHELALFDAGCKNRDSFVKADFDATTRGELIDGIEHLQGAGFQRGNFWANVVLLGRFELLAESSDQMGLINDNMRYLKFRYRFQVLKVVSVRPVDASISWPD